MTLILLFFILNWIAKRAFKSSWFKLELNLYYQTSLKLNSSLWLDKLSSRAHKWVKLEPARLIYRSKCMYLYIKTSKYIFIKLKTFMNWLCLLALWLLTSYLNSSSMSMSLSFTGMLDSSSNLSEIPWCPTSLTSFDATFYSQGNQFLHYSYSISCTKAIRLPFLKFFCNLVFQCAGLSFVIVFHLPLLFSVATC